MANSAPHDKPLPPPFTPQQQPVPVVAPPLHPSAFHYPPVYVDPVAAAVFYQQQHQQQHQTQPPPRPPPPSQSHPQTHHPPPPRSPLPVHTPSSPRPTVHTSSTPPPRRTHPPTLPPHPGGDDPTNALHLVPTTTPHPTSAHPSNHAHPSPLAQTQPIAPSNPQHQQPSYYLHDPATMTAVAMQLQLQMQHHARAAAAVASSPLLVPASQPSVPITSATPAAHLHALQPSPLPLGTDGGAHAPSPPSPSAIAAAAAAVSVLVGTRDTITEDGSPNVPGASNLSSSYTVSSPAGKLSVVPDAQMASAYRIGRYTPAERRIRLERYREKRANRNYNRRVKYDCRKMIADKRRRVQGRFVKREEELALAAGNEIADSSSADRADDEDSSEPEISSQPLHHLHDTTSRLVRTSEDCTEVETKLQLDSSASGSSLRNMDAVSASANARAVLPGDTAHTVSSQAQSFSEQSDHVLQQFQ